MTRTQLSAAAFAISALFAGQAIAATEAPVTREHVKAQLAAAVQSGNIVISENGDRMKDVFPHNYPAQPASTVTREQVKANLVEAVRNGEVAFSESGRKLNEVFPYNYPA
ncbi:MAG TPA: hypothetical protein VK026_02460 [Paenalcaligenes sp.]|nr:hypothetical protein [Paenalcaligenes sp.]